MSKLNKIATAIAIVGLAIIGVVIISESSYPDLLFNYATAIGMLMFFHIFYCTVLTGVVNYL